MRPEWSKRGTPTRNCQKLKTMIKQTKTERFRQLCKAKGFHVKDVSCLNIPKTDKEMVKLIDDLKVLIEECRNLYYTQ